MEKVKTKMHLFQSKTLNPSLTLGHFIVEKICDPKLLSRNLRIALKLVKKKEM